MITEDRRDSEAAAWICEVSIIAVAEEFHAVL